MVTNVLVFVLIVLAYVITMAPISYVRLRRRAKAIRTVIPEEEEDV